MAKTPSDKLHRLIRGLSSAEKRYFRLYVRGRMERESKYLRLFDALSVAELPDDTALKSAIYRGEPVEGKKFSELKAYLYDLILKSLKGFDEQQSVAYRLNFLLESVQVLFKRAYYDDCADLLHKASKLAAHYEQFAHQLEIIRWKKQLAYTRMDVDFLNKYLEQLQLEERRVLEQLQNEAQYRQLFFQVYTIVKREALHRGENRLTQLQLLLNHELLRDPDQAHSHRARVLFYRTLNLYHYVALEYEAFHESGVQLIHLLESKPHFLRENMADYIAALSNHILSCGLLRQYDAVRQALRLLRSLPPITEDDRRKIHRQYYTNMFVLCMATGEFEEARLEMQHYLRDVDAPDTGDATTASFYFQFCCICLGCNDFDGALHYLNEWLRQPRSVEREDLQSLARMLSLIIHYEMGNDALMDSLMRSATRFMQKKNRLLDLERRFMHLMSDLLRAPSSKGKQQAFQAMKTDLAELSDTPDTRALLQTFDLDAWLDSKIQGISFSEAVRRKGRGGE